MVSRLKSNDLCVVLFLRKAISSLMLIGTKLIFIKRYYPCIIHTPIFMCMHLQYFISDQNTNQDKNMETQEKNKSCHKTDVLIKTNQYNTLWSNTCMYLKCEWKFRISMTCISDSKDTNFSQDAVFSFNTLWLSILEESNKRQF